MSPTPPLEDRPADDGAARPGEEGLRAGDEGVRHRGDGFVLAIDLGGTKMAIAASDLNGRSLADQKLPTRAEEGAAAAIARLLAAARHLVSVTEATAGELVAVGAVSPGIVLPDRILLAPNNPGWDRLALADELTVGLGAPRVVVDTDVKAAAIAEARWGSLAGVGTGLYLNLGTGIAAAVVVDGQVLRGAHGAAGEIGYQLLGAGAGGAGSARSAQASGAGQALLEEHVGGRALGERASALVGRQLSAAEAFALAGEDGRLHDLVTEAVERLAVHVTNLVIAVDPARVAIGGGLATDEAVVLPPIEAAIRRAAPFPPAVTTARFRGEASLVGATVLALDSLPARPLTFGPR